MSLAVFFYLEEKQHRWCIAETLRYLDLSTSMCSFKKTALIEFWKDSKKIAWLLDVLNVDCGSKVMDDLMYDRLSTIKFEPIRILFKESISQKTPSDISDSHVDIAHQLRNRQPIRVFIDTPDIIRTVFLKVSCHDDKPKAIEKILNVIEILKEYWQKRFDPDTKSYFLHKLLENLDENRPSNSVTAIKLLKAFKKDIPDYLHSRTADDLDRLLSKFHKLKCDVLKIWACNCETIQIMPAATVLSRQNIFPIRLMARDIDQCLLLLKYGIQNPTFFGEENEFLRNMLIYIKYQCGYYVYASNYILDGALTRVCFLIYEAIFIYLCSEKASFKCKQLIIKLWDSIEDPYLTEEDFLEHLQFSPNNYGIELRVWPWYLEYVLNKKSRLREPRSLHHLSRCAIRKRLGENLCLPHGVDLLFLPKKLKRYLLLEKVT